MKETKKWFIFLLISILAFVFTACNNGKESSNMDSKVTEKSGTEGTSGTKEETKFFDFSGCWVCNGVRTGGKEKEIETYLESWQINMDADEYMSIEVCDNYAVAVVAGEAFRVDYECTDSELVLKLTQDVQPYIGSDQMHFKAEQDGRISYAESSDVLLLSRVSERPKALEAQEQLYKQ